MNNQNSTFEQVCADHGPEVMVVHGDSDELVPYTSAIEITNIFAKAVLKTVKGGKHMTVVENQEEVHSEIIEFLRTC